MITVSQKAYPRTAKKFLYHEEFIGGEKARTSGSSRLSDMFAEIKMQNQACDNNYIELYEISQLFGFCVLVVLCVFVF